MAKRRVSRSFVTLVAICVNLQLSGCLLETKSHMQLRVLRFHVLTLSSFLCSPVVAFLSHTAPHKYNLDFYMLQYGTVLRMYRGERELLQRASGHQR